MCFVSSVWQQIIEWISWSELDSVNQDGGCSQGLFTVLYVFLLFPITVYPVHCKSPFLKGIKFSWLETNDLTNRSIRICIKICSVTRIVKVLCVQDFVSPIFRSRSVTSGSNTSELVILTVSVLDNNKLISYSQGHQFSCCLVTHIVGWFEYCFLLLGCKKKYYSAHWFLSSKWSLPRSMHWKVGSHLTLIMLFLWDINYLI